MRSSLQEISLLAAEATAGPSDRDLDRQVHQKHVSYSPNSLKGGYIGEIYGTIIGVIKGDTRSLDYGSCQGFFGSRVLRKDPV